MPQTGWLKQQTFIFFHSSGSWKCNTVVTWCEELAHLKRSWSWERLKAGGEVDDRGWDGWMASLTQRMWVWVNSGNWWWARRPGCAAVHGVSKSWTQLSDRTELNWMGGWRSIIKMWESLLSPETSFPDLQTVLFCEYSFGLFLCVHIPLIPLPFLTRTPVLLD